MNDLDQVFRSALARFKSGEISNPHESAVDRSTSVQAEQPPRSCRPRVSEHLYPLERTYVADCRAGLQDPMEFLSDVEAKQLLGALYTEFTRPAWSSVALSESDRLKALEDVFDEVEETAAKEMSARQAEETI